MVKSLIVIMAILMTQTSLAHEKKVVKKIYIKSPIKKNSLMLINGKRSGDIFVGLGYQRLLIKDFRVNVIYTSDKQYIGGFGIDW